MKFRKKPVVIEAFEVPPDDGHTRQLPPSWLWASIAKGETIPLDGGGLVIKTLEGDMVASVGDWIIQGVKGEFYPCKPDIFAATYEPADGHASASDQTVIAFRIKEEECERLRKDAARYEWLRRFDHFRRVDDMLNTTEYNTLDAAVDAAMGDPK